MVGGGAAEVIDGAYTVGEAEADAVVYSGAGL